MYTRGITFVLTARSGLGHLRRVTTVSSAIRKIDPAIRLNLLINSNPDILAPEEWNLYSDIVTTERAKMSSVLCSMDSELAVLDTIQVPGIETCPQKRILILRETPHDQLHRFHLPNNHYWHRVLVPNPRSHWIPELPTGQVKDIRTTGWIYRHTGVRDTHEPSCGIIIATGGGGNETTRPELYRCIDAVLMRFRRLYSGTISIRHAAGPRATKDDRLAEVDEVFDPGSKLNSFFRTADLVVSTAGYNSVLELATTDTPTLLIPIPRSIDDQTARVRHWGKQLGYGLYDDNFDAAARWMHYVIHSGLRRVPVNLGRGGENKAAKLILELL